MKHRYFLYLSYSGTGFHGWQYQPGVATVQEEVERALRYKLGDICPVTGAGRTDTGVHARHFTAHFNHPNDRLHANKLLPGALNSALPPGIAVHDICKVVPEAHARFSATSRTYEYRIHQRKQPFAQGLSWFYPQTLDVDRMRKAAAVLYHYTDFTSFSKLHTQVKTNDCFITRATWDREGESLVFTITANRFLRNMVRAIVGTLTDVGSGKLPVEDFAGIIEAKDRTAAGKSAPAEGLFLTSINYPDHLFV